MLPPRLEPWLPALSDPAGPGEAPPRLPRDADWPLLFAEADRHGVLPAVVRNCLCRADLARGAEAALIEVQEPLIRRTAFALVLRGQLARIARRFAEGGVPFIVLKGPQFADRLYPDPALRPFTDLDLLLPKDALASARRCLQDIGYRACRDPGGKYPGRYGEESWRLPDQPGGTVELHWNMVNSPPLRRRLSVEYEDLAPADGETVTPSALLLMAVVHAAASNRFDRLHLLCDIVQAARDAAGPLDADWLRETAARTGSAFALATGLRLAGEAFREPRCAALAERLGLRKRRGIALLTVRSVLRSGTVSGRLRRQFYRELLKRQ